MSIYMTGNIKFSLQMQKELMITSGFDTTHVVVSVRHPIPY